MKHLIYFSLPYPHAGGDGRRTAGSGTAALDWEVLPAADAAPPPDM